MKKGSTVEIPVLSLEFREGGNTLWVHGLGGTVIRLKVTGKISSTSCKTNPISHADVMVEGNLIFCLGNDVGKFNEQKKFIEGKEQAT